jgi:hypothetical protein
MRPVLANALLLVALATTSLHAEDLRCGSRLIEVGMSRAEVLQYCGEPTSRDIEEQPVRSGKQVTGTTAIERWTYSSYSRTRTLVFDGDRLTSID